MRLNERGVLETEGERNQVLRTLGKKAPAGEVLDSLDASIQRH